MFFYPFFNFLAADEPVAVAETVAELEPVVVEKEKVEVEVETAAEPEDVEAPAPAPAAAADKDYSSMDEEERAFNVLVDLGMVDLTPDPDSPEYDSSKDDEIAT